MPVDPALDRQSFLRARTAIAPRMAIPTRIPAPTNGATSEAGVTSLPTDDGVAMEVAVRLAVGAAEMAATGAGD